MIAAPFLVSPSTCPQARLTITQLGEAESRLFRPRPGDNVAGVISVGGDLRIEPPVPVCRVLADRYLTVEEFAAARQLAHSVWYSGRTLLMHGTQAGRRASAMALALLVDEFGPTQAGRARVMISPHDEQYSRVMLESAAMIMPDVKTAGWLASNFLGASSRHNVNEGRRRLSYTPL